MFPALALGRKLSERGHEVMLITDNRGSRFIDELMKTEVIPATAFFGKSLAAKFTAVGAYLKGRRASRKLIGEFKPDAVVGGGGYASFPVIKTAECFRIPVFLIEQNSVPGRVTRMCAGKAVEVYAGIPIISGIKDRKKIVMTGNILRQSIILPDTNKGKEILVLGGSGGARALNHLGYELAKTYPRERFIILTGSRDYEEMVSRPALANLELVEFTPHPEKLYRRAKIAISRAGALSLSELLVNGIPTIFIPFPYAIDDHQTYNAQWAQRAGAALLVPEQELERVQAVLGDLLINKDLRLKMSEAGRNLIPTDAAQKIAKRIERCLAG
jgi:UDP-N-acetylglucosamine--N-acetylmuramyl-(pentapeptide) pyrophosphoryl-undecaprenol N-acetylglucosamine transferase